MRLTKEQAAANRQAIVDAAGRLFRARGFDAVSVADLMDAAGFTHGGFYNHFESKEALAREASEAGIQRGNEGVPRAGGASSKGRTLAKYVESYLSTAHRDDPSAGCTFAALSADAGRQGPAVQATFAEGLEAFLALFTEHLLAAKDAKGKRAEAAARAEAMGAVSAMVGALVLSRAVAADATLSEGILAAGRAGCLAALEGRT